MNDTEEGKNYYDEAKRLALKTGWVSLSLIQRHLELGYETALSLVHRLEHRGVIERVEGSTRWRVHVDPTANRNEESRTTVDTANQQLARMNATGRRPLMGLTINSETKTVRTNHTPATTIADIVALALQGLDGLLDKSGTILYSSHETLKPGKIYLIGLNPGGSADGPNLRDNISKMPVRSDNAYIDECWPADNRKPGAAPLQQRIGWLLRVLGVDTRDVFATNLIFTQSRDDKGVTRAQAEKCWPIHEAMLEIVRPSLIVAFGNGGFSPYGFIHSRFRGEQEFQRAGHGNWNLKRFQTTISDRETTVIGLPHLSRYKPMDKPAVKAWLKDSLAK